MTISSRTSGGIPHRCPVCGHEEDMEVSVLSGDSCCPACGQLMWMATHAILAEQIQKQIQHTDRRSKNRGRRSAKARAS